MTESTAAKYMFRGRLTTRPPKPPKPQIDYLSPEFSYRESFSSFVSIPNFFSTLANFPTTHSLFVVWARFCWPLVPRLSLPRGFQNDEHHFLPESRQLGLTTQHTPPRTSSHLDDTEGVETWS